MSVNSCFRRGCENVMCGRLSHKHGYICNDCFQELCNKGPHADIEEFMNSPKKELDPAEPDAYERYNRVFPLPR